MENSSCMNDFIIEKVLGKGSFSSVYLVRRKADNEIYAMKSVLLEKLKKKEQQNSVNEVRILASINHPNVIGYKEAFWDDKANTLNIVMEYADDGDLQTKITKMRQNHGLFKESLIWSYSIQMISGLKALHDKKILHRDLKSANIFLIKEKQQCKIGDMNVSKVIKDKTSMTQTGTPYYASPEVWKDEPYSYKSDLWSIGCVIYELCALSPPFKGKSLDELFINVCKGKTERISKVYSDDLWKMILMLLQVDESKRVNCDEFLGSELIKKKIKEIKINNDENKNWENSEDENDGILLDTIRFENILDIKKQLPTKKNYSDKKEKCVNNYFPDKYKKNRDRINVDKIVFKRKYLKVEKIKSFEKNKNDKDNNKNKKNESKQKIETKKSKIKKNDKKEKNKEIKENDEINKERLITEASKPNHSKLEEIYSSDQKKVKNKKKYLLKDHVSENNKKICLKEEKAMTTKRAKQKSDFSDCPNTLVNNINKYSSNKNNSKLIIHRKQTYILRNNTNSKIKKNITDKKINIVNYGNLLSNSIVVGKEKNVLNNIIKKNINEKKKKYSKINSELRLSSEMLSKRNKIIFNINKYHENDLTYFKNNIYNTINNKNNDKNCMIITDNYNKNDENSNNNYIYDRPNTVKNKNNSYKKINKITRRNVKEKEKESFEQKRSSVNDNRNMSDPELLILTNPTDSKDEKRKKINITVNTNDKNGSLKNIKIHNINHLIDGNNTSNNNINNTISPDSKPQINNYYSINNLRVNYPIKVNK